MWMRVKSVPSTLQIDKNDHHDNQLVLDLNVIGGESRWYSYEELLMSSTNKL